MTLGLQDRVAIVTGGTRGIGYATAKAFLEQGVRVALIARDEDALTKAAETLPFSNAETVLQISADVTDDAAVRGAVERAHSWGGGLDILVNCAGPQLTPSALAETPTEVLSDYLNAKLLGFHRMATAALPLLSTSGSGRIVNVAGQTAKIVLPNAGVTGITNIAVLALTKYLAGEAAARNVLVNAISPGMTLTEAWSARHEMMAKAQGKSANEVRDGMAAGAGIPVNRWAEPAEIASAIVFLASDLSSYMTGAVLEVDGGVSKAVS